MRSTSRAVAGLATVLAATAVTAGTAHADQGKFTWTKNGNNAAVKWKSFNDQSRYLTLNATGRQRRGNRNAYLRMSIEALNCTGSGDLCTGGSLGGDTGDQEWTEIEYLRTKTLPRRTGRTFSISGAIEGGSSLMRSTVKICYDRNITPDPCSKPAYGYLKQGE